jgi:hypothetical protein
MSTEMDSRTFLPLEELADAIRAPLVVRIEAIERVLQSSGLLPQVQQEALPVHPCSQPLKEQVHVVP